MSRTMRLYDSVCGRSRWTVNLVLSVLAPILYHVITFESLWETYWDFFERLNVAENSTAYRSAVLWLIAGSTVFSVLVTFLLLFWAECCTRRGVSLPIHRYSYWALPFALIAAPILPREAPHLHLMIILLLPVCYLCISEQKQENVSLGRAIIRGILAFISIVGIICGFLILLAQLYCAIGGFDPVGESLRFFIPLGLLQ